MVNVIFFHSDKAALINTFQLIVFVYSACS